LFAVLYDSYTPFGCSSYDPPEPLDPTYICKKCSKILERKWIKRFKEERWKLGDWRKSWAEINAAKKCNISWVNSGGVGNLQDKSNFADSYQYIPTKEYKRLSKLPYYGYCTECKAENKNAYCSNPECDNSFNKVNEARAKLEGA